MSYLKRVLLFSSPRSGSTLLANLIRSHPRIEYFNEIFTRAPYLLPNFETAFQEGALDLRIPFEKDLRSLQRYKLGLFGNLLHRSRWLKSGVFLVYKLMASLQSKLFYKASRWNYFHKVHHINSLLEPPWRQFFETQFPKKEKTDVIFIKDVRIRKAYFAFKQMYPNAYFIFLIRNPFFVVASTLKQRGIDDVSSLLIDQDYLRAAFGRPELVDENFGKTVEQTFALQWVLENEMIMDDLTENPPKHTLIVKYEDLIEDIDNMTHDVFDFLGNRFSEQTQRLIHVLKSFSGHQKHARSTFAGQGTETRLVTPDLSEEQFTNVFNVVRKSSLTQLWHARYDWMP